MEMVMMAAIAAVIAALLLVVKLLLFSTPKPFLDKKRKSIEIMDVKELSPDTKRFRLSLGSDKTPLGLPVGKHIKLFAPNPSKKGTWNGKPDSEKAPEISRSYTPAPSEKTTGYVDLVVKMYRKGTFRMPDGREVVWEDGGKMSDYLDTKRAGDRIEIMGPTGMHEYMGCGSYKVPGNTISSKHFGLLAGGTGLTPMLQLISAALKDPNDTTTFSMIYANKTEDDILCREDMEEMARTSNGRFKLHYTLDFPPENWTHKRGFITQDMIKECLPAPNLDPIIVMCGPPPMIQHACKANLEALGYNKKLWVAY